MKEINQILRAAAQYPELFNDIPREVLDATQQQICYTWLQQADKQDKVSYQSVLRQLQTELNQEEFNAARLCVLEISQADVLDQGSQEWALDYLREKAKWKIIQQLATVDSKEPKANQTINAMLTRITELEEASSAKLQEPVKARDWQSIVKTEEEEIWSGIDWLDNADVPFKKKVLYALIAMTNGGKTVLKTWLATQLVKQGKNVLYLAQEEPYQDVLRRCHQIALNVDEQEYKELTREGFERVGIEFTKKCEESNWGDLYATEWAGKTVDYIDSWLKRHTRNGGSNIDVIVVDYAKLLGIKDEKRNQQEWERIGKIFASLKSLAMQHNIVVITSLQLNREASKALLEKGRTPDLADVAGAYEATHHANYVWAANLHMVDTDEGQGGNKLLGRYTLTVQKSKYGLLRKGSQAIFDWTADHNLVQSNIASQEITLLDDNVFNI